MAVRRSIALGKAGRTMKKPTKVKIDTPKGFTSSDEPRFGAGPRQRSV